VEFDYENHIPMIFHLISSRILVLSSAQNLAIVPLNLATKNVGGSS
jgi:hypothetical protein